MWSIELLPVSGGAAVPVPDGETILGRGPLLGISDKRVSRNHALLENRHGQLRLKSTHVNPVFVQSGSESSPSPLARDEWTVLQPGDTVSLLPGALSYRVRGEPEPEPEKDQDQDPEEQDQTQDMDQDLDLDRDVQQGADPEPDEEPPGTPRNSQPFEESPQIPAPIGPQQTQTPPSRTQDQSCVEDERRRLTTSPAQSAARNPTQSPAQSQAQSQSRPRPRVLPAWMMSAAQPQASSSSSGGNTQTVRSREEAAKKKKKATTSSSSAPKAPKAPPPVSEESEEEEEEEQRPKKRRRKMNGSELSGASAAPAPAVSPEPSPEPRPHLSPSPEPEPDPGPGPGPVSAAVKSSVSTKRPPCPYGSDCYRKNPLHFQEESHPGDSDYEKPGPDEDSDQDSERPECPYGTDCYRKNPLHRKEFRHSKKPARKTRGAAPKRRVDEDDEDEDEYESSFIDSESDYEPPAQRSSSESEDLSQLQREASNFVRSRK